MVNLLLETWKLRGSKQDDDGDGTGMNGYV
jgi:hypothetical protein